MDTQLEGLFGEYYVFLTVSIYAQGPYIRYVLLYIPKIGCCDAEGGKTDKRLPILAEVGEW